MIRRFLIVSLTPWMLITATALAGELQVGAGVRVITPDPLLPVSGGLGPTHPVTEKRGELTARAVVFRRGEVSVGVVSIDALGFPSVLADRVRARVPRIEGRNILIGATHTHSAPCCYAFPDGRGGHTGDLAYIDSVSAKAAEALNEAIENLRPARIKVASDEARGKIAYNYSAVAIHRHLGSSVQNSWSGELAALWHGLLTVPAGRGIHNNPEDGPTSAELARCLDGHCPSSLRFWYCGRPKY